MKQRTVETTTFTKRGTIEEYLVEILEKRNILRTEYLISPIKTEHFGDKTRYYFQIYPTEEISETEREKFYKNVIEAGAETDKYIKRIIGNNAFVSFELNPWLKIDPLNLEDEACLI